MAKDPSLSWSLRFVIEHGHCVVLVDSSGAEGHGGQ